VGINVDKTAVICSQTSWRTL